MEAAPYLILSLSTGKVKIPDRRFTVRGCSSNKPLNPDALAWSPQIYRAPEEDRCLFMTFSNGQPITEHEIYRFFTMVYGDVLERVYVHWRQPPSKDDRRDENETETEDKKVRTPKFGKVVFKTSWIPMVLTLCGTRQTKFIVNAKPLWCKKYDPQKTNAFKKIKDVRSSSSSNPKP